MKRPDGLHAYLLAIAVIVVVALAWIVAMEVLG